MSLFCNILLICDEKRLIGKDMFAIDGCKIPSNAAKEWSGTKDEFRKKKRKMERAIRRIIKKHREMDIQEKDIDVIEKEMRYIDTLQNQIKKLGKWIKENDDKPGKTGKPKKSNITDNDRAKMKSSHGMIQGYGGIAMVDDKHQVIVEAKAFGEALEHDLLEPMVKGAHENFETIGSGEDVLTKAKLTADSGFHSEKNMKMLAGLGIDGYVADILYRKRDPRFVDVAKYKQRFRKEQEKVHGRRSTYGVDEFTFDEDMRFCICPAGKRLYRSGGNVKKQGRYVAIKFQSRQTDCTQCNLRSKCLRYPDRSEVRQVCYFTGRNAQGKLTYTELMRRKIDSDRGRLEYSRRIGTVEPVFANITHAIGLKRFTLRGHRKVNIQWKLFCIIHNIFKIHRYGFGFTWNEEFRGQSC